MASVTIEYKRTRPRATVAKPNGKNRVKKNGKNGARNGGTNGSLPIAFADPVVEKPQRKLTKADIASLPRLRDHKKQFLLRLFDSPMTLREALEIYPSLVAITRYVSSINQISRNRFGQNAIIRESLAGKESSTGFWIMKLNPKIFDVDYSGWDVKQHVRLQDVVPARAVKVIRKLAELGCATEEELKAAGISRLDRQRYLTTRDDRTGINTGSVTKGFPPTILRTRTKPYLYYLNPEFAKLFGIEITRRRDLDKMFLGGDAILIRYLSKNGKSSVGPLAARFDVSHNTIGDKRNRINERCRDLGLPEAIVTEGSRNPKQWFLTKEFSEEFGLGRGISGDLETFFSRQEAAIIRFIATHPYSPITEIRKAVRSRQDRRKYITAAAVHLHLTEIKRLCEKHGLPSLIILERHGRRYALSNEFLQRFGLEKGPVDPITLLDGERQRQVFQYFIENPAASASDAAKRFGISRRSINDVVRKINNLMTQADLPELKVANPRESPYKEFSTVANTLIEARIKFGSWPTKSQLGSLGRSQGTNPRYGVKIHGGMRKVRIKLAIELPDLEIARIARADIEEISKWRFPRFGTRERDVHDACVRALVRGAERTEVLEVVLAETSAKSAIQKLHGMGGAIRVKLMDAEARRIINGHSPMARGSVHRHSPYAMVA